MPAGGCHGAEAGLTCGNSAMFDSRARLGSGVITGVHAISSRPTPWRSGVLRDVLGFPFVDAGSGWLIFGLPPAELAAHPVEGAPHHELYLMCDDLRATVAGLEGSSRLAREISDEGFGLVTALRLPERLRARAVQAAAPPTAVP